jgi:hypothetical protein
MMGELMEIPPGIYDRIPMLFMCSISRMFLSFATFGFREFLYVMI